MKRSLRIERLVAKTLAKQSVERATRGEMKTKTDREVAASIRITRNAFNALLFAQPWGEA